MDTNNQEDLPIINSSITFFDLPDDDIIQSHIFPYLTLKDLFRFRKVSKQCYILVETCLSKCRKIDLSSENRKMSQQAFQVIAKLCDHIEEIIYCSCKWLTDDVLIPLLKLNSKIKYISLAGCQNVTENSIQVLALRNLHSLRIANLRECHWMTPDGVETLALNCPNIISVNFTSCWLINDKSINLLVTNCKRLESISLANIYGITDLSLLSIAGNCRDLRYLDLVGCWRITNRGIRMIGEYCKDLKSLKVMQCRDVTESCLSTLRSRVDIDIPVSYRFDDILLFQEFGLNIQI